MAGEFTGSGAQYCVKSRNLWSFYEMNVRKHVARFTKLSETNFIYDTECQILFYHMMKNTDRKGPMLPEIHMIKRCCFMHSASVVLHVCNEKKLIIVIPQWKQAVLCDKNKYSFVFSLFLIPQIWFLLPHQQHPVVTGPEKMLSWLDIGWLSGSCWGLSQMWPGCNPQH